MRGIYVLVIIIILLLPFQVRAQIPDSLKIRMQPVYKVIAAIKEAQEEERWYEVIDIADKAFLKDSAIYLRYQSWDAVGYARFKTGDYEGAAIDFGRSIKHHPWDIMRSAKWKVKALLLLGKIEEAAQTYEDIDKNFPTLNAAQEAAVLYLGVGNKTKFKQLINVALNRCKKELDTVDINISPEGRLLDYCELLIIADKAIEATNLLKYHPGNYSQGELAVKEYMLATIDILGGGKSFEASKTRITAFMRNQIKIAKWDFALFNRWMQYSGITKSKQKQSIALQNLIEDESLYQ